MEQFSSLYTNMKNVFLILLTLITFISCNGSKETGKVTSDFEITEAILQEQVPGIEEEKPYYKFTGVTTSEHGDLTIQIGEISTVLKDFDGKLIGKFRPADHSAIKEDLKEHVEVVIIEKTAQGSNKTTIKCKVIDPAIMP